MTGQGRRLAVPPAPDPDQRRNAAIAIGLVLAIAVGLAVQWLLGRVETAPISVHVRGYGDAALIASIEVREAAPGGAVVERGKTDAATGVWSGRVPPGRYAVEAVVSVREADFGMANAYPMQTTVDVPPDATAPVEVRLTFEKIEPYWEKPGQFRIHK